MKSLKHGTSEKGIGAGKKYDIEKANKLNTEKLPKDGKPMDKGE